ncbi:MAG: NAD(P)-dependent alcohol dehydrogenase [Bacteroidia bacterium]
MKAAIRRKYGSPAIINIENIATPIPQEDEVLIRVHATTVNRTDCANLTAIPFIMRFVLGLFKPKQIVLGTDFAGEIIELGKNVQSFEVNDRVFGFSDNGLASQAEYICVPAKGNLFVIPDKINYQQAAASLEGAHYAYSFIHKTNIQAGQRIFINGATGAIGSALLQLVKQYDVHITASCNTKSIALIKSLGADKVYDYTKVDFSTLDDQYDFVFDAVGKSTFGKCKAVLKKEGIYISSELGPYAQNIFFALSTPFGSAKKVIFPIPYSPQETIPYIQNLLGQQKFVPLIDREYALEDISTAYEYVLTGEKIGNVVIDMKS